ncbi:MAG: hypothetical protein K2Y56_24825 [Methylobacterium sp.]|uniref:hypothetical protein n=1 Tax=Methylobacterium sp. TaxID=409 RepID=UPI0025CBB141|nr:hypothetical protein [Methylobacterium sp.]MBX9934698.1 hypothetical protein [Methylobacterium sp.]
MITSPILRSDLRTSVARLQALEAPPTPKTFAAYSAAVTAFSALESAFIPVGQTDTRLREEVRTLLKAPPVAPVAEELQRAIERRVGESQGEPKPEGWMFLDVLEDIDIATDDGSLAALSLRRLRVTAYCALIAYGPAGTTLPGKPDPLVIDVEKVPGPAPRIRWRDASEDDDADVPVVTLSVGA